jgi:hypothetical protein
MTGNVAVQQFCEIVGIRDELGVEGLQLCEGVL